MVAQKDLMRVDLKSAMKEMMMVAQSVQRKGLLMAALRAHKLVLLLVVSWVASRVEQLVGEKVSLLDATMVDQQVAWWVEMMVFWKVVKKGSL